jgi:hypothetical protein
LEKDANIALFESNMDLAEFWQKLLNCAENQIEFGDFFLPNISVLIKKELIFCSRSETRISVLNLISHVLNQAYEKLVTQ